MSTLNVSLADICAQRKKQMLFTIPPPRTTIIDKSPYPQYSQSEINMRRKAEILKYTPNKQSTQTNSITKNGRFSQIMTNRNRVDLTATPNNTTCPENDIIYTSSVSSGVPGPPIDLYLDNSVPLYNYVKENTLSGISDVATLEKWLYIPVEQDTIFNDDDTNLLFSLNITNSIDLPKYTYNVNVPIGFNISGIKLNDNDTIYEYKNILISLDTAVPFEVSIKYNNNYVQNVSPIVSYSYNSSNLTSFSFDISNNANQFSASLYAGILNISNIGLFTEPGYVYDFYIKPKFNIKIGDGNTNITSTFNVEYDISYGAIMNLSENITSDVSNCVLLTEPSEKSYVPFTFENVTGPI